LFIIVITSAAQVEDTFADNDFTSNPTWTATPANNWTVVNGQLRSNSNTPNSSFYITTPSAKATEAQWEFAVTLSFNTSGTNYADVYLVSEQSDLLSTTNNGYFVRIGGTPDEVSLYKIVNGVASILINGTDGVTNKSNNTLRVKIIRESNHQWTLYHDAAGGINYSLEGTTTDNAFSISNFFGIRITQSTAGFFNKHFFDDIYAGEIIRDTQPPVLETITVLSQTELSLLFDEKLDASSAQKEANYRANNDLNGPNKAVLQADEKTVILTFGNPFSKGINYELTVNQVSDLVGNSMNSQIKSFLFFQAQPVQSKDIIFTEIFADVSPQVGLPEAEFIEVYNRSNTPVDISGWKFSDGSSTAILPSQTLQIILPGQYKIICANNSVSLFNATKNVIGVSNFPTLNNSGEAITLRTSANKTIDSVRYSLEWYRDEDKQEGGWTLELIDPNNPCGEDDNWAASEAERGGTPGQQNSIFANKPDLIGPRLLSVRVNQPNELLLTFNEKLDKFLNASSFTINPTQKVVFSAFTSASLREVKIGLDQPLEAKKVYTLEVNGIRDCSGNPVQEEHTSAKFALPQEAEEGDVLINEILFNPKPGGVDFVEVYNASEKYINLKNWSLANLENEVPVHPVAINVDYILAPQHYLILTSNGTIVKQHYPNSLENTFLITPIPSINDDEGSIAIIKANKVIIDSFEYRDDFHSAMLKDKEGVSLERISFSEKTQQASNWKSASSAAGFATPGFINSNARPEVFVNEDVVSIEPEIFSKSMPGQDFARINYHFDQGGLIANVKIVDHQGRIIKEVANNETLALEGFFRWDGDRDDASPARRGYYFVWFEVFDVEGTVKTHCKRIVVAQ